MKRKQSWNALLTFTLIGALLASCSGEGTGGGSKGAQPQSEGKKADGNVSEKKPDVASEPAEIVFYSNNGDPVESFDYKFGNSLRNKFPNYTIKYIMRGQGTNLPDLLAAGTRFDIFFQTIGNFENYAFGSDIQYDMTELIATRGVNLSRFEPTIIDAVKQASGGKLYALPITTTNLVLYYNKTIFDKFGVAYPNDGMTWDEVNELAKKLTRNDGGTQYIGYTHSPTHSIRMNQLSLGTTDLKTDTPTINTDERWKKFFQTTFLDPVQEPSAQETLKKTNKIPDANDFVKTKNVAMFGYMSHLVQTWEEQFKGIDWDFVSLPTFKEMPGVGSQSYPSYFGITKMAKHKEAAMEVLKYMASDEFQAELARKGLIPVLKDQSVLQQLGKESSLKDKNWKSVFHNKFAPIPALSPIEAELAAVYTSYATKAQIGTLDLNTALRQAEEDAKKKIAEYKQRK